jgi:2-(1,2-epoxy-1,2-dihydrophenyl)acetyl-CoA isomerase
MAYETLLTEQDGGVLLITLNRPDKLNAFTDAMLGELIDAFRQAERDGTVRAVLITGAGRGFCPGQDLGDARQRQESGDGLSFGEHLRRTYNPLILKMRQLPKPIIAAVNGVAAGAGMSLAMACDFRIAAESASFLQAFVKVGLIPDSGSTWMLPRLVGMTRALDLMLTGRKIDAREALSIGLVNQVVPDSDLMPLARQIAGDFASAPTRAIGFIKRALDYSANHTLEETLSHEADLQEIAGRTADHKEGIAAFLEKRPARFSGE